MYKPVRSVAHRKGKLHTSTIYLITFLFTLHFTPAVYILSSYLNKFFHEDVVSMLFTIAAIFTFFAFLLIRESLRKYGNTKTFIAILIFDLISLVGLIIDQHFWLIIAAFILNYIVIALAFLNLDIFIESQTPDDEAGGTRGLFLTSLNTAFILGPLIAGLLIKEDEYWRVFVVGIFILIIVMIISIINLRGFDDPHYKRVKIFKTFKNIVWRNKPVYHAMIASFLLRIFYAWMIIYTPIYLNAHLGLSWQVIGILLAIALTPFVILEAWIGHLADEHVGERTILSIGYIITAIFTASLFFLEAGVSVWIPGALLFMTRVGASMIEVTSESYLFRHIESKNLNIISIFRILRPVAYIVGPFIGYVFLKFFEINVLFIVLAVILLYGLRYSLVMKERKF